MCPPKELFTFICGMYRRITLFCKYGRISLYISSSVSDTIGVSTGHPNNTSRRPDKSLLVFTLGGGSSFGDKTMSVSRETATDNMLWAFIQTRYPEASRLIGEITPGAYILGKPNSRHRQAFNNLNDIATRLTITQIENMEVMFDIMTTA